MKYLRLDKAGGPNPDYCFAGEFDDTTGVVIRLKRATAVGDRYPDDPLDFEVHLDEDMLGLKRPGLIGNARNVLIISAQALQVFEQFELGQYEAKPFTLINHKGRPHSTEYVLFNGLQSFDLAHPSSAFLRFDPSGDIYDCDRWVIDSTKLKDLPDVVRPNEVLSEYLLSDRLVAAIREAGLENFELEELDHV